MVPLLVYRSLSAWEAWPSAGDTEQSEADAGASLVGSPTSRDAGSNPAAPPNLGRSWTKGQGMTACRVMGLVWGHCGRLLKGRVLS